MYFSAAALLALAASAVAQTAGFDPITKPGQQETIPAGTTYQIGWQPSADYSGTVTLTLLGGASPSTLQEVSVIAKSVDNSAGSYSWTVASNLGDLATYGIRINLDSDSTIFQYSFPFAISAGSPSSSSSQAPTGSASSSATTKAPHVTANNTTIATVTTDCTTSTPVGNLSTTATHTPGKTTITSVFTPSASNTTAKATSTPSSVVTSGSSNVVAGSIAMIAGLVAALYAL